MNTAPKISAFSAPPRELLRRLLLLALLLPLSAVAEINSTFTVPPYTLDDTIVGIEGWEMRNKPPHPVFTDPMGARVIESPIVGAEQPTTLHLRTLLTNDARLSELGDHLVMEAQFALTFNPYHNSDGGLYFRMGTSDEYSPFVFGFYHGEGGGLYYQGQEGRVIVLPKVEMQQSAAYRFTVHVDMAARTFSVLVTSPEDKTLRHEVRDIPFQDAFKSKLGSFCMGNNKSHFVESYIDHVKVTPSLE